MRVREIVHIYTYYNFLRLRVVIISRTRRARNGWQPRVLNFPPKPVIIAIILYYNIPGT